MWMCFREGMSLTECVCVRVYIRVSTRLRVGQCLNVYLALCECVHDNECVCVMSPGCVGIVGVRMTIEVLCWHVHSWANEGGCQGVLGCLAVRKVRFRQGWAPPPLSLPKDGEFQVLRFPPPGPAH